MATTRAIRSEVRKPVIGIQVINITCTCGAACENESGSTMIEYFNKVVWCSGCNTRYEVPASVFAKKFLK